MKNGLSVKARGPEGIQNLIDRESNEGNDCYQFILSRSKGGT